MDKKTYDVRAAVKAQDKYCSDNNVCNFCGDGVCPRCGRNVFMGLKYKQNGKFVIRGFCVEDAGRIMITGCPHCGASFVE